MIKIGFEFVLYADIHMHIIKKDRLLLMLLKGYFRQFFIIIGCYGLMGSCWLNCDYFDLGDFKIWVFFIIFLARKIDVCVLD